MPTVEEVKARERVESCPKPHWEFRSLNFFELFWHNTVKRGEHYYNFRCLNCGQLLTW